MEKNQLRSYLRQSLFLIGCVGLFSLPAHSKDKYVPFKNGDMYQKGYIDLNKNGKMDPYENPALDAEHRITDLLGRMTMEEKNLPTGHFVWLSEGTERYFADTRVEK